MNAAYPPRHKHPKVKARLASTGGLHGWSGREDEWLRRAMLEVPLPGHCPLNVVSLSVSLLSTTKMASKLAGSVALAFSLIS